MSEKISLYIPTPCHENWDSMTPTQQGRFCSSCAKQVVDFSLMTDQQVLNYFKSNTGNTCGRFMTDQLQRPLQPTAIESKKSWWIALMMPVLLLFEKAGAQKRQMQGKVKPITDVTVVAGGVRRAIIDNSVIMPLTRIKGTVTDEDGSAISWATVTHNVSGKSVATDSAGEFNIELKNYAGKVELAVSFIGYERKVFMVEDTDSLQNFVLKKQVNTLSPVSVLCNALTGRLGGVMAFKTVSYREKLDTVWRKATGKTFSVYPNPVQAGNSMSIDLRKKGDYSIQLISNASSLILAKDVSVIEGATLTYLIIPSNIAAGIYYLRVIDKAKKRPYTDKILVQ